MTNDHGVRDLLSFLLARDTMHQNMWQAAAAELQAEGAERLPALSNFPQKKVIMPAGAGTGDRMRIGVVARSRRRRVLVP
jgi:Mn-containing catalase